MYNAELAGVGAINIQLCTRVLGITKIFSDMPHHYKIVTTCIHANVRKMAYKTHWNILSNILILTDLPFTCNLCILAGTFRR